MGLLTGLSYVLGLSVLALYAAVAAGSRVPRAASWGLVALAACLTLARCERLYEEASAAGDYYAFYASGRAVLTGGDPYAPRSGPVDGEAPRIANGNVALNPPTALPLFALFGLMPMHAGYMLFVAANVALAVVLPWLASRALGASPESERPAVMGEAWPLLAATLVGSWAFFLGTTTGQVSLLVAAALTAALGAQEAGRPYLAGVCLGLATVKPNTTLPFLLLYLGRRDLKTWVALCLTTAALILVATSPAAVLGRLATILGRIAEYGGAGRINDPSFANPNSVTILGIDRVLYCLGLTHRGLVSAAQAVILVGVGLALARRILLDRGADRSSSIALVSIYAVMFLYHRQGDAVLLILPLTHAVGELMGGGGSRGRRWALAIAVASMLATLYVPGTALTTLWARASDSGAEEAVRVLVLPLANYGLIAAFASLWVAASIGERGGSLHAG